MNQTGRGGVRANTMKPTKEQTCDEKINPLMAQIIDICSEHKIAMLASFSIPTPEDDGLLVTTALCQDSHNPPKHFLAALDVLRPQDKKPLMMRTKHADGSQTLTAIIG